MNNLELYGCKKIKFPKILKKKIENNIVTILNDKFFYANKNYKKINKVDEISSFLVKNISQKDFISMFGHVSYRYLSHNISKMINRWVKKNLPIHLNTKKISLHFITKTDLKKNRNLLKNQFCIYFRCVRPNSKTDIGKLHRDIDFWQLLKERQKPLAPFKFRNIYRMWIPIFGCNKQNSLRFYKKSHLDKNIKTNFYKKNGALKPTMNIRNIKNKKFSGLIKNFKNEAILFRDDVVHFAPVNKNKRLVRYSVECSIVTD